MQKVALSPCLRRYLFALDPCVLGSGSVQKQTLPSPVLAHADCAPLPPHWSTPSLHRQIRAPAPFFVGLDPLGQDSVPDSGPSPEQAQELPATRLTSARQLVVGRMQLGTTAPPLPPIQISSLSVLLTNFSVRHAPGAGVGPDGGVAVGDEPVGVGPPPDAVGTGVVPGAVLVGAGVGVGVSPPTSQICVPSQPAAL